MEVPFRFNDIFEDEILHNNSNSVANLDIFFDTLDQDDLYSVEINYDNISELNRYHRSRGIRLDLTSNELERFDELLDQLITEHVMTLSSESLQRNRDDSINLDNKNLVSQTSNEPCVICMEIEHEIDKNNFIKLNCNHLLHEHCLSDWIKYNQTCPVCRSPVKTCKV